MSSAQPMPAESVNLPEQPIADPVPEASQPFTATPPAPEQSTTATPLPFVQPAAEPQQPATPQPQPAAQPAPQMVYVTRPMDPGKAPMSEEVRQRHADSCKRYPSLNLTEGEYVVSEVKRHPIGLIPIFGLVGFLLVGLGALVPFYNSFKNSSTSGNLPPTSIVGIIVALLCLLVIIGGYVAVYVYTSNKFYLTNESIIQEIHRSLFERNEQTVSLSNVEDASYEQHGILPYLLNYGYIRLSTVGDETTYRFTYVSNPKEEIARLNNAVEAFKNGRPVATE